MSFLPKCEKSLEKRGECNLLEINLNMYHATAIAAIVLLLAFVPDLLRDPEKKRKK